MLKSGHRHWLCMYFSRRSCISLHAYIVIIIALCLILLSILGIHYRSLINFKKRG